MGQLAAFGGGKAPVAGKRNDAETGFAANEGFAKAAANIDGLDVLPSIGANVYDILKHEKLVLTAAAVEIVIAKASTSGKKVQRENAEAVA